MNISIITKVILENHKRIGKTNAELQWTDPSTKVTGEFTTTGSIFPPIAQNGFLLFPSF